MNRIVPRPSARPRPHPLRCKCGDRLLLTAVAGLLCPSCTKFIPTSATGGRKGGGR